MKTPQDEKKDLQENSQEAQVNQNPDGAKPAGDAGTGNEEDGKGNAVVVEGQVNIDGTIDPNTDPNPNGNPPADPNGKPKREKMEDIELSDLGQPLDWQESTHTIKKVVKEKKKYRFDAAVQRNTVWKPEQKSLFIHSLIEGYPIPPAYAHDSPDKEYWMLDGKQRFTTVIDFIEGNFEIENDTQLVFGKVDISNKYFDELPKSFQEQIYDSKLKIIFIKGITEDQIYELFRRLNNGSPLKPIEMTRALLGATMETFRKISNMRLFTDLISLSPNAKNRFVDEELVMQTVAVMLDYQTSLATNDLRKLMLATDNKIIDEKVTRMAELTKFMEEAFDSEDIGDKARKKILKKVNVPMLYLMAEKVDLYNKDSETNKRITPQEFGEWAKAFLYDNYKTGGAYGNASSSGVAKKDNVIKRVNVMTEDFNNVFFPESSKTA